MIPLEKVVLSSVEKQDSSFGTDYCQSLPNVLVSVDKFDVVVIVLTMETKDVVGLVERAFVDVSSEI